LDRGDAIRSEGLDIGQADIAGGLGEDLDILSCYNARLTANIRNDLLATVYNFQIGNRLKRQMRDEPLAQIELGNLDFDRITGRIAAALTR
jgi:hypothetical protein